LLSETVIIMSKNMALLRRELHRQVRGPEVTHADHCTLVFDTDTKSLYVECEVVHLEVRAGGEIEMQTAAMDIADYLKQGGQTAGHRELWRLLRTLFNDTDDAKQLTKDAAHSNPAPPSRGVIRIGERA
jgi:hypothetical protein